MAGPDPSPSTTPETSRGPASRIDRLYYTRPAPLLRGRRWLMFLAFVAALGWAGWALTDKSHQIAPGAVVAAHATWENDCQACHVPLSPIREGGWQEKVFMFFVFFKCSRRTEGSPGEREARKQVRAPR